MMLVCMNIGDQRFHHSIDENLFQDDKNYLFYHEVSLFVIACTRTV